ncbi:basic proline-rich protein-like isoform X2 [Amphibalanus amphitrite]|nr:basic proline-rich protein-like isoform X2 [Amphibalanus amphitrite]XP_043194339.1 basic proline-rich protein-like isoform X2 [Amphibalanus amphitrite]
MASVRFTPGEQLRHSTLTTGNAERADAAMELPKSLALCLVCNKDLGPLNQIPTFYHRPNVLFSRTPATSTLLRHKLEAIVKDIVVFRSETCCLCVKCAGLINLADALEAELKSVCRQLSDHYWRTARLRGFGEERAIVCITPLPPPGGGAAPGGAPRRPVPPQPQPQPPPQQQPQPPPPPPSNMGVPGPMMVRGPPGVWAPHGPPGPVCWPAAAPGGHPGVMVPPGHPGALGPSGHPGPFSPAGLPGTLSPAGHPGPAVSPAGHPGALGPPSHPGGAPAEPGRGLERSVSHESDDGAGVCQLLSAVEVELTEVKEEPPDDADASDHLMREPVDIEVDPWRDLGYEDANAMEKLASQKTRSMPPPSQAAPPARWPMQPPPPGLGASSGGSGGRQTAVARPTRTYSNSCPRPEVPSGAARPASGERPPPPANLPPGAQKTHQRIMKTLTSHSSAIQQAVANGVLSLEVRPPGAPAPPPPPQAVNKKGHGPGGSGTRPAAPPPAPPRSLPNIAPAPPKQPAAGGQSGAAAPSRSSPNVQLTPLSAITSFKIKLPSSTPREGVPTPPPAEAAPVPRPVTPPNIDAQPANQAQAQVQETSGRAASAPGSEYLSRIVAWFHKSQRLRPGNYTYIKSGDSLNGKLIPIAPVKGRPPRRRPGAGPIVRLVVGTPMNRRRYPPLEKALAMVTAATRGVTSGPLAAGRAKLNTLSGPPKRTYSARASKDVAEAPSAPSPSTSATEPTPASEAAPESPAEAEEKEEKPEEEKEDEAAVQTPARRGRPRGRPRKDGLPPGSVESGKRKRGGNKAKRPAADSQSSTPSTSSAPSSAPAPKRQRLERPPEGAEGRRHSRRLSARLSQLENQETANGAAHEPEQAAPPPKQGDSTADTDAGETTTAGDKSSNDDPIAEPDGGNLASAAEQGSGDTDLAPSQNGPAGGGAAADEPASPCRPSDEPATADSEQTADPAAASPPAAVADSEAGPADSIPSDPAP